MVNMTLIRLKNVKSSGTFDTLSHLYQHFLSILNSNMHVLCHVFFLTNVELARTRLMPKPVTADA